MSGLKSAYDLAMERMEKKDGKLATLTAEQKKAIAEVDSKTRAAIAELEIMLNGQMAEATAAGDLEKVKELQDRKTAELNKIRERSEGEKESIRRQGG